MVLVFSRNGYKLTNTQILVADTELFAKGEKTLMAALLREWLCRDFEDSPRGAKWTLAWKQILSITIYSIVKARNKLSIDEKSLETEEKRLKHAKDTITQASWRVRKHIKFKFIELVQKRNDDDDFRAKVYKLRMTYLFSPIWAKIDYTDDNNPELHLFPNYMSANPKEWLYRTNLYEPKVGIGTHSLRPRGPGGSYVPMHGRSRIIDTG